MSSSINIQLSKTRLASLLKKINSLEFEFPNPNSSLEQLRILYTTRKQVIADKIDRVQLCVKELEDAYDTWLKYIQTITMTKKREEEKAYECVIEGENELFRIMHEGKEALITLTKYKDDAEQKLKRLFKRKSKKQQRFIPPSNPTVNLPQLLNPDNGGFNAAVHSQKISEIQKLNYLFSCLRGTITTILYNELRAIKRNEKERMPRSKISSKCYANWKP